VVLERSSFLIQPRDAHGNLTTEEPRAFKVTMAPDDGPINQSISQSAHEPHTGTRGATSQGQQTLRPPPLVLERRAVPGGARGGNPNVTTAPGYSPPPLIPVGGAPGWGASVTIPEGGAGIGAIPEGGAESEDREVTVTVARGADGALVASYLPRVSGDYQITITLHGAPLRPQPLRCAVRPTPEEPPAVFERQFRPGPPPVSQDPHPVSEWGPPSVSQGPPSVSQGPPSVSLDPPSVSQGPPPVSRGPLSVSERRGAAAARHGANTLSWDSGTATRWEAHRQVLDYFIIIFTPRDTSSH